MAAIYNIDGNEVTVGLQGCNTCDEALAAARCLAAEYGEAVVLVDDDGEWLISPDGSGELIRSDDNIERDDDRRELDEI